MRIRTAIIGASGYAGAELLRLLSPPEDFEIVSLVANSQRGQPVTALHPHLTGFSERRFEALEDAERLSDCRLLFSALPHAEGARLLPGLKNDIVVDLSGDFRLKDAQLFRDWYQLEHPAPGELGRRCYGLPELFRAEIRKSKRIANSGCYATAVILALAPLLKAGVVEPEITAAAVSGVSGAGRTPAAGTHFVSVAEDFKAYKVGKHQHTPEIEMALEKFSGRTVKIGLVTHLAPLVRGIHVTCTAQLSAACGVEEILAVFKDCYSGSPFVAVTAAEPGVKEVRGTNQALICPTLDLRLQQVVVTCVLDNLVKGAAGQALQNANLALGFEESRGLTAAACYP